MADTILTLKQIEDLFQNITTQMLGLDPELPENQDIVRISWPTYGAPAWKITQDRVFIRVTYSDGDYNKQRHTVYAPKDADTANQTISYTNIVSVNWVLYGPNGYDNADVIRNLVFSEKYRSILAKNNLYLILNVQSPMRIPELYNGQWWERTDITLLFNELVIRENSVYYIKSAKPIINK